jgi:hypothetical protein
MDSRDPSQLGDARAAFMPLSAVSRSCPFRHPMSLHYSGVSMLSAHAVCAEAPHKGNQLKECL